MLTKYLNKLKTSEKISLAFSVFNLISLCLLLLSINIIYFFIWYGDQKEESLKDINIQYGEIWEVLGDKNMDDFKLYLLKKDVLIMPDDWWELVCSEWVWKKIHDDISKIEDEYFYNYEDKTYFIFSKHYEWIWLIKILFDTTPYVKAQLMIIKTSIFIILFFIFVYYLFWKIFAKYSLRKLNEISEQAKKINLNEKIQKIEIEAHPQDEIKILANTLNLAFEKIGYQSENQKQFIIDVSHEFKTPLMIINSKIDLYHKKVEKNKVNKNDIYFLLDSIKSNTKKLNKLLETMFLLSRFQDEIIDFNKTEINLWEYIKIFSDNLLFSINNKNVLITYKISSDIFVEIEKSTFNILLENILTNAIKFSNPWGNIEIWIEEGNFWVKDTWIWIDSFIWEKVWNKFFRTDENIEGFWVWLFIVKRIIKLYNWKIEIKSTKWEWTKVVINFKNYP